MDLTYMLHLAAPLERVFELIDDDQQNREWMVGLEETECLAPFDRANPVGKRFVQRLRLGGMPVEYHGEVNGFKRPHHVGMLIRDKGEHYTMQVDYRLAPTDRGTKLTYSCSLIECSAFGRTMVAGSRMIAKRMLKLQMTRLKEVAEQPASAGTA